MSVVTIQPRSGAKRISHVFPWAATSACLALLIAHLGYDLLTHAHSPAQSRTASLPPDANPDAAAPSSRRSVSLSAEKLNEAQIATEAARFERLTTEVPVVGLIQVNSDRQVEVRPRAPGIVREVHALQGQNVKHGDPLVTLDSPEIGTARLNLRARQRELSTARFEAEWKSDIAANVERLIPRLQKGIDERRAALSDDEEHTERPVAEPGKKIEIKPAGLNDARRIEREFAGKQLGAYRGTLLQAYAEFDIASHEEQKTRSLRRQQIVGEHPALVARHTREGIQAKLEAAIEQVRFDAAQEKRLAYQKVRQAEAAVVDAAQRLRILGVAENIQSLLDHADLANTIARDEDVTFYRIVAPFDGTIIKKAAVFSKTADTSDILFVLADLRSVWLTANISESELGKLSRIRDGTIRLTATAYPDRQFSAKVLSVGRVVDPQTRTVPLLAQTDNTNDLLVPGMFVRIYLDSAASEQLLTIPMSAVVEIESEKYVFVPRGKGTDGQAIFALKPVEIGRHVGDRVVVKAGLGPGDSVVAAGTFLLKSELVLQNEPDEE
jgi:cobalt-zinc-cadmium efflux system membrane fusion protein